MKPSLPHLSNQPHTRPAVRLTIVLPTRERSDTLYHALRTCVEQQYEQLEIIVSDNASQDATREVVLSFADPRIRYVNTGKRVSMSENWEYALSFVQGEYVTFLGDDDGFVPGAIAEVAQKIAELGPIEALAWEKGDYSWPDHIDPAIANLLNIPLAHSLKMVDAAQQLQTVVEGRANYLTLPCLYNSFVRMDVIRAAMAQSGRFFCSVNPDIYSGVALACMMHHYCFVSYPYIIAGNSRHSTGASTFQVGKNATAGRTFVQENSIPFFESLVLAPSVTLLTIESLYQAQRFFERARAIAFPIERLLKTMMAESANDPPVKYQAIVEAVRAIGAKNDLAAYAEQIIEQYPNLPRDFTRTVGYNPIAQSLRVRADDFGVATIYDACLLCKHILVMHQQGYLGATGKMRSFMAFGLKQARRFWRTRLSHYAYRMRRDMARKLFQNSAT